MVLIVVGDKGDRAVSENVTLILDLFKKIRLIKKAKL